MNRLSRIRSKSLQAAFLRDEIPEAMVWLREEGFDKVEPEMLELRAGPVLCACGCCGEVPDPDGAPALRGAGDRPAA